MTMADVKPCPFCGGDAFVEKKRDQYIVKCFHKDRCYLVGLNPPRFNIEEVMVKQWNRRVKTE